MDIWGISIFYTNFFKNKNTHVIYLKKLLIIVLFMCER